MSQFVQIFDHEFCDLGAARQPLPQRANRVLKRNAYCFIRAIVFITSHPVFNLPKINQRADIFGIGSLKTTQLLHCLVQSFVRPIAGCIQQIQ